MSLSHLHTILFLSFVCTMMHVSAKVLGILLGSSKFSMNITFRRRLCTDFPETLPHDVGSSAIEVSLSEFLKLPLKRN